MKIIEVLNNRIDKLLFNHQKLKNENEALKKELEFLRNSNDELIRNNQDMFLKIDSTLICKGSKSE